MEDHFQEGPDWWFDQMRNHIIGSVLFKEISLPINKKLPNSIFAACFKDLRKAEMRLKILRKRLSHIEKEEMENNYLNIGKDASMGIQIKVAYLRSQKMAFLKSEAGVLMPNWWIPRISKIVLNEHREFSCFDFN